MDAGAGDTNTGTAARPRTRYRGLRIVAGLVIAGLIAFGTYRFVTAPGSAPQTRTGRFGDASAQPVGVAAVTKGDIKITLDALGTVTPLATVTVKPQIAGELIEVGFQEGQEVKKGDFLAQIDPRPYQVALEQDQGQLTKDQAVLAQAQSDLARYQGMLKANAVSRQQVDDQAFLVQQTQGTIQADQAAIDTQKLNLDYCHIVAPVSGRVGLRQVDAGNYVQLSDANGLVVITQMQPISVIFTLPEDNLPQILARTHAGATLQVIAFDRTGTKQIAVGTLSTVDNQIDTSTGTVKLRAAFDNTDESLFPNQFVNARLLVDTLQNVVTVPSAAIQHGAPGTFVYLVGQDGTVSIRTIQAGAVDGQMTAVESGLAEGDKVVIDGTDRLRDGAHVTVATDNGTATPAGSAAPAGQNRRRDHSQGQGQGQGQGQHRRHDGQTQPQTPGQPAAPAQPQSNG